MNSQGYHSETLVTQEPSLNRHSTPVATASKHRELKIVWRNVFVFIFLHIGAGYGLYLLLTQTLWSTRIWIFFCVYVFGGGITAGAHRLWSHKSYKAKLPLSILLMIAHTYCVQNSIMDWVRDHRMHHKYSETDADPYNASRGFFFSHIGWLLVRKHPDIKAKAHTVDLSDIWADPVLRFQHKYYVLLSTIFGIILPVYIPTLWGETLRSSIFVSGFLRYLYLLHATWLVNSLAHAWGMRPYDKNLAAVESKTVHLLTAGEGFHNYHHAYPWDYKAAELGNHSFDLTTKFIEGMAKIGWAYDLRTVSPEIIESRVKRTGDGSHKVWGPGKIHENEEKKLI